MDTTEGLLTTHKVQSLIDAKLHSTVLNRRDLQLELCHRGAKISRHGVEAWFRRRDSNLPIPRPSVSSKHISYKIPRKWWRPILEVFNAANELLTSDESFQGQCFKLGSLRQKSDTHQGATVLIDRSKEVALLDTAFQNAELGNFSTLYFEGEAGIGKSKIIQTFREQLGQSNIVSLMGICTQGNDIPLLPILAMLKMNKEQLSKLNPALTKFIQNDLAALQSLNSTNLGAPDFFLDLAVHLCDLAREQTTIIILDDVHWMDEMTCRFIDFFMRHLKPLKQIKLLLICCSRPGVPDQFPYNQFVTDGTFIQLQGFQSSGIKALVERLTTVRPSPHLIEFVWQSSRGNPQHAQQFFRHLQSQGLIINTGSELQLSRIDQPIDLPPSLMLLNKKLISQLAPFTLELIQVCALIGASAEIDQFQLLFPHRSSRAIVSAIAEAEENDILRQRGDQFEFKHPLMRSTVYKEMTGALRAQWHISIADLLKTKFEDAADPLQMLEYASHIVAARGYISSAQLARTCFDAALLCKTISAWELVLKYADIALATEVKELQSHEKLQLQQYTITGLHQKGQHQEALLHIERILSLSTEIPPLAYAAALNEKVRIKRNYGLYRQTDKPDVDRLEAISKQLEQSDPALAFDVYITLSTHYLYESQDAKALNFALNATVIPGGEKFPSLRAKAYVNAAMVNLSTLNLRDALLHFSAARTQAYITGPEGDTGQATRTLQRTAIVQLTMGRCFEAERTLQDLHEPAHRRLNTGEETISLTNEMCIAILRGDTKTADRKYSECIAVMNETGYAWSSRQVIAWYAAFQCRRGNERLARDTVMLLETEALYQKIRPSAKTIPLFNALLDLSLWGRTEQMLKVPCPIIKTNESGIPNANGLNLCANSISILIAVGDKKSTASLLPVLLKGYQQGVAITLDWPICLPLLISKCYSLLGNTAESTFYQRLGRDLISRERLTHFS